MSPLPATMRAAVAGDGAVAFVDRPLPVPMPDEVLIRVRAAALNRADLGMAAGKAHGSQGGPGTPLGMEWAGEVVAVGASVTGFAHGDRVLATGSGAFAEYAVADRGRVLHLPRADLPFDEATTLPVALETMHDAIVSNGRLRRGESVLIQGASSGVGLMGLQVARECGAGLVIGSSTDAERRARLVEHGAHLAVDPRDPTWPERVREATGGRGVDLIVDQLSGSIVNGNLAAAAVRGRIVNVGRLAGNVADFDFDLHALKRIDYVGVTFRTRSVDEVRDLVAAMVRDLWPAVAAGRLRLPISARYPFARLGDALAAMATNRHFGKIVVVFD